MQYKLKPILNIKNKAIEVPYRRYYSELSLFFQRFILQPAICEDLIQDLYLKLWVQGKQWEPKGPVRAYLYKAALNKAVDYPGHKEADRKLELKIYGLECFHQVPQQQVCQCKGGANSKRIK